MNYAEIEIGLHRGYGDGYALKLRAVQPDSVTEEHLPREGEIPVDLAGFPASPLATDEYGRQLAARLFADRDVWTCFERLRGGATPLRVRLLIDPSAPELHNLHWEKLRHPDDGSPLLAGDRLYFSRFLSSTDWRPFGPRARTALRALVVVANPTKELERWQLTPIDVAAERQRAVAALDPFDVLPFAGPATLDTLDDHLRRSPPDLLYLVGHGRRTPGGPVLYLEGPEGEVAPVPAAELAERMRRLGQQPRLVVLASCQSAAAADPLTADDGALAALGPLLARAGIPAVVAMQDNVFVTTATTFMSAFFKEIAEHGQIDRAVAIARNAVIDRPDSWMPTLFMRLRSGRLWYEPGFTDDQGRRVFTKWPSVVSSIAKERCTIILGAGLLESLVGSPREFAERLATDHHFPLAPYHLGDLPQVAEYLAVTQNAPYLRAELESWLRREMLGRLPPPPPAEFADEPLERLIARVGAHLWECEAAGAAEPHGVLARLPAPVYVTANPDNLLAAALRAAGTPPRVEAFDWRPDAEWDDPTRAAPADGLSEDGEFYEPSPRQPLIFHLFGHLRDLDTLVVTEDNYFDYLINVRTLDDPGHSRVLTGDAAAPPLDTVTFRDGIPPAVAKALSSRALIFLGFRVDDWDFRVLFRSIVRQGGGQKREAYSHVAVQVDPEEHRILDIRKARDYLAQYFQKAGIGTDISVYWGTVADFIGELQEQAESWKTKTGKDLLKPARIPTKP